jgi:hypothetical protein
MVDTLPPIEQQLTSDFVTTLPTSSFDGAAIADPHPGIIIGGQFVDGSAQLDHDDLDGNDIAMDELGDVGDDTVTGDTVAGDDEVAGCRMLTYATTEPTTGDTVTGVVSDCQLFQLIAIDVLSTNRVAVAQIRASNPQSVNEFFYATTATLGDVSYANIGVSSPERLNWIVGQTLDFSGEAHVDGSYWNLYQPGGDSSQDDHPSDLVVSGGGTDKVTSPGAVDRTPGPGTGTGTGILVGPVRPSDVSGPTPSSGSVSFPLVVTTTARNPSLLDIGSLSIRESTLVTKTDSLPRAAATISAKSRAPGSQFRYFRAALSGSAGGVAADVSQDDTMELASRDSYFAFMVGSSVDAPQTSLVSHRVGLRQVSTQTGESPADRYRNSSDMARRLAFRQPFQSLFQAAHEQRRVVILPHQEAEPDQSEVLLLPPVAEVPQDRASSSTDAAAQDHDVSATNGPRPSTTSAVLLVSMLGANHRQSATLLNRVLHRLVSLFRVR